MNCKWFQKQEFLGFDQKPSKNNCSINKTIAFAWFLIKTKQILVFKHS
jgi:hypothetical protein